MERQAVIPFRWVGRGLDIRALVVDSRPLFAADDICTALDAYVQVEHDDFMDVDEKTYPAPTFTVGGLEVFDVDTVRRLADERPMYVENDRGEVLDWFEDLLEQMAAGGLDQLAAGAVPAQPGLKAGESYSVARAAKVLAEHRGRGFGQQALFRVLDEIEWIHRDVGHWVAEESQLQAGHLVTQEHRVGPLNEHYTQVRITPAGLEQLHSLMREPTLVEI